MGDQEGIKFRDITNFIDQVCGGRSSLGKLSCGDVLHRFIVPATSQRKESFASIVKNDRSGHPNMFPSEAALIVAYSMDDPFLDVVDALKEYLSIVDTTQENPDLWLEMFCINYHVEVAEKWVEQVERACRKIGNTILIMSPWDSLNVFRSPLCLYQIYFTGAKGLLLDIAMTRRELERFSRVAEVSKTTIDRILTSNIRLHEAIASFGRFAPQNAEMLLLESLLDTKAHEHHFCRVVYDKIREWLREFYEHRTFLSIPTNPATDIYTFKVSEWIDKSLCFFQDKSSPLYLGIHSSEITAFASDTTSSTNWNASRSSSEVSSGSASPRFTESKISFYLNYLNGEEARRLGPAHHSVVSVMEELVVQYRNQQQYLACLPWLRALLITYEEHHGRYQPETLSTMLRLALLLRKLVPSHGVVCDQESIVEAENILLELIDRLHHIYEDCHPNILMMKKLRADIVFENLRRHDQALSIYRTLYESIQPLVGYKHFITVELVNRIGSIFIYHMYQVLDGLSFARKALEDVSTMYGSQDPIVAMYEANYQAMMDAVHRYDKENGVSTAIPVHLMISFGEPGVIPSWLSSSQDPLVTNNSTDRFCLVDPE
jgi:hypothetical protein